MSCVPVYLKLYYQILKSQMSQLFLFYKTLEFEKSVLSFDHLCGCLARTYC